MATATTTRSRSPSPAHPTPKPASAWIWPALDRLVRERVLTVLDHQHLNHVVPEFASGVQIPTTESVAGWIWSRVAPRPAGARLVRLRLSEDVDLWVDLVAADEGAADQASGRPAAMGEDG